MGRRTRGRADPAGDESGPRLRPCRLLTAVCGAIPATAAVPPADGTMRRRSPPRRHAPAPGCAACGCAVADGLLRRRPQPRRPPTPRCGAPPRCAGAPPPVAAPPADSLLWRRPPLRRRAPACGCAARGRPAPSGVPRRGRPSSNFFMLSLSDAAAPPHSLDCIQKFLCGGRGVLQFLSDVCRLSSCQRGLTTAT
jgi:hypothetical protein